MNLRGKVLVMNQNDNVGTAAAQLVEGETFHIEANTPQEVTTLEKIPFGEVVSYGQIADTIGNPNACRAVGSANGKNPISIIIPCHRVVGSDGSLTGYGGGLWRKEWLIKHEKGYHPNNIIA